jgi:hypothetical protein
MESSQCCICLRFTKKSSIKLPHMYRWNNGSPVIGNKQWIISPAPKIAEGRVYE